MVHSSLWFIREINQYFIISEHSLPDCDPNFEASRARLLEDVTAVTRRLSSRVQRVVQYHACDMQ
jgi:hypothetical protein